MKKSTITILCGLACISAFSAFAQTIQKMPSDPSKLPGSSKIILSTATSSQSNIPSKAEQKKVLQKSVAEGKITQAMADSMLSPGKLIPPPKVILEAPREVKVTKEQAAASLKPKSLEANVEEAVASGRMTKAQAAEILKKPTTKPVSKKATTSAMVPPSKPATKPVSKKATTTPAIKPTQGIINNR